MRSLWNQEPWLLTMTLCLGIIVGFAVCAMCMDAAVKGAVHIGGGAFACP